MTCIGRESGYGSRIKRVINLLLDDRQYAYEEQPICNQSHIIKECL